MVFLYLPALEAFIGLTALPAVAAPFGLGWPLMAVRTTTKLPRAPAYSSVRFILHGLDGDAVEREFRAHASGLLTPAIDAEADELPAISVDGKTLRGSFDAFNDRKAVHLLSAFAADEQIILGHLAIDEKSNEIPAAQALIAALGLEGRLYTLDAMHCQKNI